MTIIVGLLIWYFVLFTQDDPEAIASCGDCYCIPEANETCPTSNIPRTNYTNEEIDAWTSFELLNPYRLGCNPYGNEDDCETIPSQKENLLLDREQSVCAIHFEEDSDNSNNDNNGTSPSCHSGSKYQLKTYSSRQAAEEAAGKVTHVGHCGVCSSLQDLATYIQYPDLTSQGKFCAEQGASFSFEYGRDCYRSLGLTDPCAAIWAHSSWNTAKECLFECLVENEKQPYQADKPNNGPAPECKLNDCLQCDLEVSGTVFEKYAGRTQRRSGLLSTIARPCDQFVLGIDHVACPGTQPIA